MNRWISTWRRWLWINPIIIALNIFNFFIAPPPLSYINLLVILVVAFMTGVWFADWESGSP